MEVHTNMRAMTAVVLGSLLALMLCSGGSAHATDQHKETHYGRPVVRYPTKGGIKGEQFDDLEKISSSVFNICSIAITSGDQVDSIQVTYILKSGALHKAPKHGGGSGRPFRITLAADEYVAKIKGSTDGVVIKQLTITTKRHSKLLMKEYGPFGKTPGYQNFTLTETFTLGFRGRSSDHLNSIGVYSLAPISKSDMFGSFYGNNYREYLDTEFPPAVKISEIHMYHDWKMNAVQFQYQLHGGGERMGSVFGDTNDHLTIVQLSSDEELIGIRGEVSYAGTFRVLYQLTFLSQNMRNGTVTTHGPFGPDGDESFSLSGHIIGCEGVSWNDALSTIIFYYY